VLELPRNHPRCNVRLDTLVRLRWLAVIGGGARRLFWLRLRLADLVLPRDDENPISADRLR